MAPLRDPVVSVVMPVFNDAASFVAALESARNQTFTACEFIIVDDGSAPSLSLPADAQSDPRVRITRHASNLGTASARNTGIKAAKGRFIAFLDADDLWLPTKLESQLQAIKAAGAGPVAEDLALVAGYRLSRGASEAKDIIPPAGKMFGYNDMLWGWGLSPGSTLLVARSAFEKIGLFDTSLSRLEDWDWLLRFTESGRIASLPEVLVQVNNHRFPPGTVVSESLEHIEAKHARAVRKRGFFLYWRFRSTIFLERAAMYYRAGDRLRAVRFAALCILCSPGRNRTFYLRIFSNFFRMIAGKSSASAP